MREEDLTAASKLLCKSAGQLVFLLARRKLRKSDVQNIIGNAEQAIELLRNIL